LISVFLIRTELCALGRFWNPGLLLGWCQHTRVL
jgi:hypothetical protein